MDSPSKTQWTRRLLFLFLAFALLAATAPAIAQQEGMQQDAQMQDGQMQDEDMEGEWITVTVPVLRVTPGQIADNPTNLYGDVLRVTGEVEEVFGAHSFTLDEERLGAGPDVLVVTTRSVIVPEDDVVTVVGYLRPLVRTEWERDYDWFDWDWWNETEVEVETEVRPVLVASSIITEDGVELLEMQ